MNKKLTKTLIKHYNICFKTIKGLANGFEFFWKGYFLPNLDKP